MKATRMWRPQALPLKRALMRCVVVLCLLPRSVSSAWPSSSSACPRVLDALLQLHLSISAAATGVERWESASIFEFSVALQADSGAERAHGLPKDESAAAAFATQLTWDSARSSSNAKIDGSAVQGTAGDEAWARAAEGFSSGCAYWRLKYEATGTNKKGGLGVVAAVFSDVDDYTPPRQKKLWIFTNGPEGSAYAEGREVTDEGMVRGSVETGGESGDEEDGSSARFFDYYTDEVGVLLDCDKHALGIYRRGELRCVIKDLPPGETFHPAVAVNCKHHTYHLALTASRQARAYTAPWARLRISGFFLAFLR